MADVFLAIRKGPIELAKLQVLKSMRPELAEDPEFVAMFVDEARLALRLNHPNVVQTTAVDECNGRLYLAMEYLDGQPLSLVSARARRSGGVELALAIRIVSDVLAGLQYAHALCDYDGTPLGIVHRDVSPGNIFVTYDGQVKLVDFGVAKAAVRAAQTQVGMVKGKTGYMAPEQTLGRDVDQRADLYSIGVVLWELATGRSLMQQSPGLPGVAYMGAAPMVRTVRPEVPIALERICAKALAKDRSQRYSTAVQMHDDLDRVALDANLVCSGREVAAFMARAFPGERGAMRALIERRIGELRDEGELVTRTVSVSAPQSDASRGSQPIPDKPRLDSVPPEPTSVSMRPPRLPRAPRRRQRVAVGAAGVGAAVGVLLAVRYFGLPTEALVPVSPSSPVTGTQVGPPPAQDPEPPTPIQLRIVATPVDAQILLDGAELSGNPFSGRFPRDGRSHRIEVRAEGHEPRLQVVEFASDVQLIVTLEVRTPRPKHPPAPSTSVRAPPAGAKARAIDTADPWR